MAFAVHGVAFRVVAFSIVLIIALVVVVLAVLVVEFLHRVAFTEFDGHLFFMEYAASLINVDFVFVFANCCFSKLLFDFIGMWALVIHNTEQVSYVCH